MAVKKTEELLGVSFSVRQTQAQVTDDKGQPIYNGGDGGPRMQDVWVLDLVDANPFQIRTIHVPLSKEAKDELVRQLTGGIVIAGAGPAI